MTQITTCPLSALATIAAKEMATPGEEEDQFGAKYLKTISSLSDGVVVIKGTATDVAM